jgi:hypothetical protein
VYHLCVKEQNIAFVHHCIGIDDFSLFAKRVPTTDAVILGFAAHLKNWNRQLVATDWISVPLYHAPTTRVVYEGEP